jgi:hypothetical protein
MPIRHFPDSQLGLQTDRGRCKNRYSTEIVSDAGSIRCGQFPIVIVTQSGTQAPIWENQRARWSPLGGGMNRSLPT